MSDFFKRVRACVDEAIRAQKSTETGVFRLLVNDDDDGALSAVIVAEYVAREWKGKIQTAACAYYTLHEIIGSKDVAKYLCLDVDFMTNDFPYSVSQHIIPGGMDCYGSHHCNPNTFFNTKYYGYKYPFSTALLMLWALLPAYRPPSPIAVALLGHVDSTAHNSNNDRYNANARGWMERLFPTTPPDYLIEMVQQKFFSNRAQKQAYGTLLTDFRAAVPFLDASSRKNPGDAYLGHHGLRKGITVSQRCTGMEAMVTFLARVMGFATDRLLVDVTHETVWAETRGGILTAKYRSDRTRASVLQQIKCGPDECVFSAAQTKTCELKYTVGRRLVSDAQNDEGKRRRAADDESERPAQRNRTSEA